MLMPNKLCTPAKEISTFIHSSIQYLKTDLMQMHIFPSALTSSVASSRFPKYLQVKTKSKEKRKKIILPIDIKMIMLLFFFLKKKDKSVLRKMIISESQNTVATTCLSRIHYRVYFPFKKFPLVTGNFEMEVLTSPTQMCSYGCLLLPN